MDWMQNSIMSYIYPYGDLNYTYYDGTWAPKMIAKVWPKGENSGDPSKLQEVKNPYVIPYPVAEDDDRICFYLSKERLSDAEGKRNVDIM